MKKLIHYQKGTAEIVLLTGMHIGGSKESIKIGGVDSPVIRNPITNLPYIPGSSLKGKFRMALELKYDDYSKTNAGPSEDLNNASLVAKLFGSGSPQGSNEATRLIFRDAKLSDGYEDYATGEEKMELRMDRSKLAGASTGPRTQERVAAGAKFDFEVMIRIFESDNEELFKNRVEEAMALVENEYIGGSGSRGYGQVKFENVKWEKVDI